MGLGNPGDKYKGTRHNVGFMVVERLAGDREWKKSRKGVLEYCWLVSKEVELIKPLTFMNESGKAVNRVVRKHGGLKVEDVWVVHDDLDLKLGEFKIQEGKGPKDHKGVNSIEERLGNDDFWRVRIGVDGREGREREGREYVLSRFGKDEKMRIEEVIEEVINKLEELECI